MVKRFLRQKLREGEDFIYLNNHSPLDLLEIKLHGCRMCRLSQSRNRPVFGEGSSTASIMLVGEAPGREEDKEGRPFVGRAGKLLRSMLTEIGVKDIYITNVVKCHPLYDRDPKPDEISACYPYLKKQIEIIAPDLIVSLGRIASSLFIGSDISITKIHGRLYDYQGIRLIPTFHPAFLIRNPNYRNHGFNDLIKAKELIYG